MVETTLTKRPRHPLPGSAEAVDLGCMCPSGCNREGAGAANGWLVADDCPVHAASRWPDAPTIGLADLLRATQVERDRYFNMKRVNAGLYAAARAQVQKARAVLGASLELYGNSTVGTALDILGELPPTDLHLHDLLDAYERLFRAEYDAHAEGKKRSEWTGGMFRHLIAMCTLTQDFFDRGETEKANRWLGFIQGCLWVGGYFTIDAMRAHNKGRMP